MPCINFPSVLARDIARDQIEMLMAKRDNEPHFAASDRPICTQSSQVGVDVGNDARVDFLSLAD